MKEIKKILYIGADLHIEPVIDFFYTKEFIFIDTQPFTEFEYKNGDKFNKDYCRKNFINELKKKSVRIGFVLEEIKILDHKYIEDFIGKSKYYFLEKLNILPIYSNPTIFVFKNVKTKQIIKYYVSLSLKNNIGRLNGLLEKEIKESDSIIISNKNPDLLIFDYFMNKKILIRYSKNWYNKDKTEVENKKEENNNKVINLLKNLEDKEINLYFSKFYLIKFKYLDQYKIENNKRILQFNNYSELKKVESLFNLTDEDI
jgi:hypothetical protein